MATDRNPGVRPVRIRHYQGDRLFAGDLQDEYDNITWLRDLHVVALHDTWGIALGFDVHLGEDGTPASGSQAVVVGAGFAYDCMGREIVLSEMRAIPGPQLLLPPGTADGRYELVMSYDTTLGERHAQWHPEGTRGAELRPTVAQELAGSLQPCTDLGAQPGREQPAFAWRRPGETRLGLDVPLLALRVSGGSIDASSLDQSVRYYTQPLARPHIAAGLTSREQKWEFWRDGLPGHEQIIGFQTEVDTSDAGFVGTPYYVATLYIDEEAFAGTTALVAEDFRVMFTSLANESATGFTFRLIFTLSPAGVSALVARRTFAFRFPWSVSWLGVEPVSGCPPPFNWRLLLRFSRLVGLADRTLISSGEPGIPPASPAPTGSPFPWE